MARHRRDDEPFGPNTASTDVMPAVVSSSRWNRRSASPLLITAGVIALTLVLSVGAWALAGGGSKDNPLVFPWSSGKPGEINVSVSMQPTDEPSEDAVPSPSGSQSPSARPSRSKSPSPSASPSASLNVAGAPTPSAGSASPGAGQISVSCGNLGWSDGRTGYVKVNAEITNGGGGPITVSAAFTFDRRVTLIQVWNATSSVNTSDRFQLTGERPLSSGRQVDIGGIVMGTSNVPDRVVVNGQTFTCSTR